MERVYTTPLLDKLGVRPGMRVALIAIEDAEIRPLIADRTTDLTEGTPEPDTDVVLFGAETPAELAPLATLATRIRPNGAIWIVSRKGKAATLRTPTSSTRRRPPAWSTTRSRRSPRRTRPCASSSRSRSDRSPRNRPITALAHGALYHPRMDSLLIILIVVLIVVVLRRGPKTLPRLGEALGRGVKEAKTEATKAQAEIQARTSDDATPTDTSGDRPA